MVASKGFESIWEYSLNVKNNTRYDTLYNTAAKFVPDEIAEELLIEKLIRPSKDVGDYIITAYGIKYVEELQGINTLNSLVSLIDDRYFTIETRDVTPREKIVLFSMVMIRCFAKECCIDARKDDSVKDYWMEIFVKAQDKLKEFDIIPKKTAIEDLGKGSDIEHPMSNIIRHTDALDAKVKMLFKKTGKNQYYLDLSEENEIRMDDLIFILKVIFNNKLTSDSIDNIAEFCNDSARMDGLYVLDLDQKNFSNSDYDDVMYKAFKILIEGNLFSI